MNSSTLILFQRPGYWFATRAAFYAGLVVATATLFVVGAGIYALVSNKPASTLAMPLPTEGEKPTEVPAPVVLPAADPADQVMAYGVGRVLVSKVVGSMVDFDQLPQFDGKIETVLRDPEGNSFAVLSVTGGTDVSATSTSTSPIVAGPIPKSNSVVIVPLSRFKWKKSPDGSHLAAQVDSKTETSILKLVRAHTP